MADAIQREQVQGYACRPEKSKSEIVLYEVVYHQRAEPLDDFATNTSDLSTLIEGLEPNTDYTFQLRAYTSKGPGPWNNRLPFRTFGSCTLMFAILLLR